MAPEGAISKQHLPKLKAFRMKHKKTLLTKASRVALLHYLDEAATFIFAK